MKRIVVLALMLAVAPLVGCPKISAWDQQIYTAASGAQADVKAAQAAYEVSATTADGSCPVPAKQSCIPHTAKARKAIESAIAAQRVLDQSLVTYEMLKANNAAQDKLTTAQLDVATALGSLQPLITDVKALASAVKGN